LPDDYFRCKDTTLFRYHNKYLSTATYFSPAPPAVLVSAWSRLGAVHLPPTSASASPSLRLRYGPGTAFLQ